MLSLLSTVFLSLSLASSVVGQAAVYYQCGGLGWTGDTTCVAGATCVYSNAYYSQCLPDSSAPTTTAKSSTTTKTSSTSTKSSTTTAKTSSTTSTKPATTTSKTTTASGSGSTTGAANDVATVGYATLNGGTTGGSGGTVTTVNDLTSLTSAVAGSAKKIVIIGSSLTGDAVVEIGPNTTVLGKKGTTLTGIGLRVLNVSNVIIRNVKITKVLASAGDAIGIQASSQVWIDHCDLSSDRDHDKDYYDGLLDITHGCTGVTVTYTYLYTHWKASLIGHSDDNGAQDVAITVTMAYNYWYNLNSRTPSFRFGHGHIFNNYFLDNNDGINTRDGAQLLVENNVWSGCDKVLYETDTGYAVATGNDYGGGSNTAPVGTFTTAPYSYNLLSTSSVVSSVTSSAGQTLTF